MQGFIRGHRQVIVRGVNEEVEVSDMGLSM
jgi:hypothetical protein